MTCGRDFKVLIAGGGPAAIEAVLALRKLAPSATVELLSPEPDFVFRPLSVLEPFARPGMHRYPLCRLEAFRVNVREASVQQVDTTRRIVVTDSDDTLPYDALLVAIGARSRAVISEGLTFGGPNNTRAMRELIQDLDGGSVSSLAFVSPEGATWSLPLFELALQTAERAQSVPGGEVRVTFSSAEDRPLEVFGEAASELLEGMLEQRGIRYLGLDHVPAAQRHVTTPVLEGRPLAGLPADAAGFLAVDSHGRVIGVDNVWAAGDGTDFPIKQDGLATQQAGTAARSIASEFGYDVESTPFEPVLRGILVANFSPWYLRRRLNGIDGGQVSQRALWSPPSKITGQHLAPFLDRLAAEAGADPLLTR
jgi:sulfide:quinone oxidoreductase